MPNLEDYLLPDGRYYFDNAATTPMSPEALRVYTETAERWFMNPMSFKDFDPEIETLLTNARSHVADFVGGDPYNDKVIFTSGATESINLLLKGYFFANFQEKRKIVTSPIEHKAVLETCKYLESIGAELEYVNITTEGVVDYDHLETIVDKDTLFVCLMHVNNETGEISDLQRIYEITKAVGTKFFTDTTQSLTKLEVNSKYFDACVGSAHKFHGPKGVGFLFLRGSVELESLLHGGGQEFGSRAGTHNLPGILALKSSLSKISKKESDFQQLNSQLVKKIKEISSTADIVQIRLHILLVSIPEAEEKTFTKHLIYSKGSACQSGIFNRSSVYEFLYPKNNIIRLSL